MKKEMLINVLQPEECRIAIVEDGVLEELYVERASQESYVGNIYKGRIVNIEPSIQAAFVDFGIGRNGFLHVSDVEQAYYRHLENQRFEGRGRRDQRGRPSQRGGRHYDDEPPPAFAPPETEMADLSVVEEPGPETPAETPAPEGRRPRSDDERPRGRGRGRRRSSTKRERSAEEGPAPTAEMPQGDSPGTDDPSVNELSPGNEPPPPRFMDSAEHRTDEPDSPHGNDPTAAVDDDLLFFPRTRPEPQPAPRLEPTPEPEPEPAYLLDRDEPDVPLQAIQAPIPFGDEDETNGQDDTRIETEFHPGEHETGEELEDSGELDEFAPERYQDEDSGFAPRRPPRQGRNDRRGSGGRPPRRMMGRPGAGRPKPLIQDIFKRGQEVLVQVIKEGIGTKGPTLSTYISIAGRYLVLMPGLNRVGVSRKIADDDQRRRLRDIFHELQPPKGLGFIIRTAGMDKTKKELQRDLAYLARLWQVVVRRIRKIKGPAEIYQESDMITRTIRDTFTNDIDTIWVDEPGAYEHAQEFLQIVMPRYASRIKLYTDSEPMFHKYGIEEEIARIQRRHVPLPAGGSIVIDQTEALVAIDVNSGNFRADNNAEETAYQMNLHAAKEIARQLRLRDLGGVIVNDFIDMREDKHRRDVERALRDAVKRDRARTKILKISQFGIIEMTRQRIRPSLKRSVYQDCPHCHGTSQVKTCESMSIDVMRMLQLAAHRGNVNRISVKVHEEVANYLLNRKRKEITRLEEGSNIQITVGPVQGVSPESLEISCYDNNNNELKFAPYEESRPRRR